MSLAIDLQNKTNLMQFEAFHVCVAASILRVYKNRRWLMKGHLALYGVKNAVWIPGHIATSKADS